MKLFKSYTFTWWQIGILKLSLLAIGIAIGANWPQFFFDMIVPLVIVGFALGLYLAVVALKK